MGMFDSAYIECTCPTCNKVQERECQTKDADCVLSTWKVGDVVNPNFKYINCIASCDDCDTYFDLKIQLDTHGRLSPIYNIIK